MSAPGRLGPRGLDAPRLEPGVALPGPDASLARLEAVLAGIGRVVVAFSGGADSAAATGARAAISASLQRAQRSAPFTT